MSTDLVPELFGVKVKLPESTGAQAKAAGIHEYDRPKGHVRNIDLFRRNYLLTKQTLRAIIEHTYAEMYRISTENRNIIHLPLGVHKNRMSVYRMEPFPVRFDQLKNAILQLSRADLSLSNFGVNGAKLILRAKDREFFGVNGTLKLKKGELGWKLAVKEKNPHPPPSKFFPSGTRTRAH